MTPMTRLLVFAAAFGLAASAANACDVHQMHTAGKVDETKVASVAKSDEQKMSTPDQAATASTVIIEDEKTAPAETE
jgi:uncharacterized protein YdbL (DUF1318 family)